MTSLNLSIHSTKEVNKTSSSLNHEVHSNMKVSNIQMSTTMNQSSKIRSLAYKGKSNSQIAKTLGIRYQTVWRTLNRSFKGVVPQTDLLLKGIRTSTEEVDETEE